MQSNIGQRRLFMDLSCAYFVFRVSLDIEIRYVISQSKQIKLKEKIGYFEESRIFPQSLQVLFQFI